ncbi:MAG: hypothetical protein JWM06_1676 [Actinomycetia bacterium]|nr:hypothetical protein [Actinomycetes bacterium]
MPVQIGLAGGTTLMLSDPNARPDDVIAKLSNGRPDYSLVSFVPVETTEGTFRVNPAHVVYVREIDAAETFKVAGF